MNVSLQNWLRLFFLLIPLLAACPSQEQTPGPGSPRTTPAVDSLGVVTANQVRNGLGFGLDPDQDWQWAAAAAAGATHARMQCSWDQVEQQTAPPFNAPKAPQYIQTPACLAGFASARKYGIHPTVNAAYGAPHHQILTVTVPGGAAAGATTVRIAFASGVGGSTFSNLAVSYDYFGLLPYGQVSSLGPYYGTYISAISLVDSTHAILTLASALTASLPADGTAYAINEVLYPSAASSSPNDPSVVAYSNYVSFLAQSMAAAGVTGDIELWNEPPSATLDPWDNRFAAFDSNLLPPAASAFTPPQGPNFGFVANLQNRTLPAGITLTWNGTSGDGSSSILGAHMKANTGVAANQPASVVTSESFHPYGGPYGNPEDVMWSPACLQVAATAQTSFAACGLSGERQGPNNIYEAYLDTVAKTKNPAWGVGRSITETNILPPSAGYTVQQARFVLRQYLGFQAMGFTPIEFYKLYDANTPSEPNFSFIQRTGTGSTYTPKPGYTAISGLMADLAPISNLPVGPSTVASVASVASYQGSYPLTAVHLVGARTGAVSNSEMFVLWQRSTTPCTGGTCVGNWVTMTSPNPAQTVVLLPVGMKLTSATNLTTRGAVAYTLVGQTVTLLVDDNPVALILDPAATVSVTPTTQTYTGNPIAPTVTTVPAGLAYTATYNGATTMPVDAGTYTVVATLTDPLWGGANATGTLVITPAVPTLAWSPSTSTLLVGQPVGTGILDATSNVAGTITYTLASATQSAVPVTAASQMNPGSYTLSALFTPANPTDYTAASATTGLIVLSSHVWVTDQGGGISVLAQTGQAVSSTPFTGAATGIAIAASSGAWSVGEGPVALYLTDHTGQVVKAINSGTGGLDKPMAVAIDGSDQVWVANANGSVSLFLGDGTPVSPKTGYTGGGLASCSGIALDPAGSVWITNQGNSTVTRILGAADPVAPLTTSTANHTTGTRP